MKLIGQNCLSEEQTEEVRGLEALCREAEPFGHHVFLSGSLNSRQEMNCFFLAYEGEKAVGFLTLFQPGGDPAEVTAFVHPGYRRRGIFTALLEEAKKELVRFGIDGITLCHEPVCASGGEVLKTLSVSYNRSEYTLEYSRKRAVPQAPWGLELRIASREEISWMAALSEAAFGEEAGSAMEFICRFFDTPEVTPYVALLNGRAVGEIFRNTEGGEVYLCNVCVEPGCQGKGIGRGMLSLALELALKETGGPIRLDVDDENPRARHLYESVGFEEACRMDYYDLAK